MIKKALLCLLGIVYLSSGASFAQSDTITFSVTKKQGIRFIPEVDFLAGGMDNFITIEVDEGLTITDTIITNANYESVGGRIKISPLVGRNVKIDVTVWDEVVEEQIVARRSYSVAPPLQFTINRIAHDSAANYFEFLYAAQPVILNNGLNLKTEVLSFDVEFVVNGRFVALSSDNGTMTREIKGALVDLNQPTEVLFSGIKVLVNDKIEVRLSPYRVYIIPQNSTPVQFSIGTEKH